MISIYDRPVEAEERDGSGNILSKAYYAYTTGTPDTPVYTYTYGIAARKEFDGPYCFRYQSPAMALAHEPGHTYQYMQGEIRQAKAEMRNILF